MNARGWASLVEEKITRWGGYHEYVDQLIELLGMPPAISDLGRDRF